MSWMLRPWIGWMGALAVMFVAVGCAGTGPRGGSDLGALGLEYQVRKANDPRPNRLHILRVDLAAGKIRPAVVVAPDPDGAGPVEVALTHPLKLARDRSVLAFVNSNPWDSYPDAAGKRNRSWHEGQPVDIQGLAGSGRRMRSPSQTNFVSIRVGEGGRVFVGDGAEDQPVAEGMAGFQQIVREGTVVVSSGGPLHPRTAIGVDLSGTVLWCFVVDGRQPKYSEGMSLHELGSRMRDLGCWNAVNMDGGGSSIMGLSGRDGRLRVVNRPSDRRAGIRRIRPLPTILTFRRTDG